MNKHIIPGASDVPPTHIFFRTAQHPIGLSRLPSSEYAVGRNAAQMKGVCTEVMNGITAGRAQKKPKGDMDPVRVLHPPFILLQVSLGAAKYDSHYQETSSVTVSLGSG